MASGGETSTQHQLLLVRSVDSGDEEGVVEALRGCARPDHIDDHTGTTCLHAAAQSGHSSILARLLRVPLVNADTSDKFSRSPLAVAVEYGRKDCVAVLLHLGASPTLQGANGQTCLHLAARLGNHGILEALLTTISVMQPDVLDKWGKSPLMVAVESDNKHCAELLLDRGACPAARSSRGEQPLLLACTFGHLRMVKLLKDRGVNIFEVRDCNSSNALHYAVCQGAASTAMISFLLAEGLDPLEVNSRGESSLQLAWKHMPHYAEQFSILESGVRQRNDAHNAVDLLPSSTPPFLVANSFTLMNYTGSSCASTGDQWAAINRLHEEVEEMKRSQLESHAMMEKRDSENQSMIGEILTLLRKPRTPILSDPVQPAAANEVFAGHPVLSERLMLILAENITPNDGYRLAINLGIKKSVWDTLEQKHVRDPTHALLDLLCKWMNLGDPQVRDLAAALTDIGRCDLLGLLEEDVEWL